MRNKARDVISTKTEGRVEKSLTLVFLLILTITTIVRIVLSAFPKTAATYFDELFYLELSQNIFLRGAVNVYTAPLSFTKLLYPILISPFYAVTDGILRTQLITAFNALLISSALVPGYLLARRILKKTWQIVLVLLFLAFSPNLLFSVTFMAENLYYPLLLWAFYAAYSFFASESRKPLRAFGLGILAFLLYFTKEVGAGWAFAAFVALAAAGRMGNKKSRREVLLPLGCYLLGIILPYLLIHLTLLSGLGYSYARQASLSNLSDSSHVMFFLYATGFMFLYFMLSLLFFPVVLPVLYQKKLSPANRAFLLVSVLYAAAVAAGIGFGVSMFSDFGKVELRLHLRYFLGAAFPFLLLSLCLLEDADTVRLKSPLTVSSAVFAILCLFLVIVPFFGSFLDSPAMQFLQRIPRDSLRWRWALRLAVCGFLALMLLLWNKKRKQAFACLLIPLLLIGECVSDIFFYDTALSQEKITNQAFAEETRRLDSFIDTLEGHILLLTDDQASMETKMANTILNDDYSLASFASVKRLATAEGIAVPGQIDLKTQSFPDPLAYFTDRDSTPLPRANYIVTIGRFSSIDPKQNEEITPEGISSFHVYRAANPEIITLQDPRSYPLGKEILFYGPDPAFRDYQPEGFSDSENGFTWSATNEVSLTLKPDVAEFRDLGCVWTWRMTIGDQPCQVFANDVPVFDGIISDENGEVYFIIPEGAWSGSENLTLRFLFPEAREPGNGDPRILAVAFESLTLE